jgi:hypothetical protein
LGAGAGLGFGFGFGFAALSFVADASSGFFAVDFAVVSATGFAGVVWANDLPAHASTKKARVTVTFFMSIFFLFIVIAQRKFVHLRVNMPG